MKNSQRYKEQHEGSVESVEQGQREPQRVGQLLFLTGLVQLWPLQAVLCTHILQHKESAGELMAEFLCF